MAALWFPILHGTFDSDFQVFSCTQNQANSLSFLLVDCEKDPPHAGQGC